MPREFSRVSQSTQPTPSNPVYFGVEALPGQTTETFAVDGTGRYKISVYYLGNGTLSLINSSGVTITTLTPGAWGGSLAADTYRVAVATGTLKNVAVIVERLS